MPSALLMPAPVAAGTRTPGQAADKSMAVSYSFSSARDTSLDRRVAAVQQTVAAAGGASAQQVGCALS
jgi:hypothetical protein